MSIKSKMLVATAVLTLAGGLSAAGTLPASAATPQCGNACVEVYSMKYATPASLGFVETVFLGIPLPGVPTIVRPASSSNPAEDLIVPMAGPVSRFYAQGMVPAAVNEHYGSETAVQLEYAPHGNPTGLCAAVATTAHQNEAPEPAAVQHPGHHRVDPRCRRFARDRADLLPDRQRVGHRLCPPVRDDHPGEPGLPAVHADHPAAPEG